MEQMPSPFRNAVIRSVVIQACYAILLILLLPRVNALSSDIHCLKAMKDSLEDPFGNLLSWTFDNQTEGFICGFTGVECWHVDENKVLNLRLSNMGLRGQFPRGLANCTSITALDLSFNNLFGSITPQDIQGLSYLCSLDVSSNSFSGEIPSEISSLLYLNLLKLDNNQLTGEIPEQLGRMPRLKIFSVSNNYLTGPVPEFANTLITAESFANNTGLCGYPLETLCGSSTTHLHFFEGFMVGWSILSLLSFTISLMFMPKVVTMKQIGLSVRKKRLWKLNEIPVRRRGPAATASVNDKMMSKLMRVVNRISLRELSEATNSFSEENVIAGSGKIGKMYKAELPNGWFLAIKRLPNDSWMFEKQFLSELMSLGRLRHANLVPLIGFCLEEGERLLVYNYMSRGNLYDWLNTGKTMEWPFRVKIAVGIARGLSWLHHHSSSFQLVHGNLSSKCILLDQNFEPKLSNFWEAKLTKPIEDFTESGWGSFASSQEHWEQTGSAVEDIYSYGIILLELITRKEPCKLIICSKTNNLDTGLVEWIAALSSSSSAFYDAVDKSLIGQGFDCEMYQFLKLASHCIIPPSFPDERPSMHEVYQTVRATGERYHDLAQYSEATSHSR